MFWLFHFFCCLCLFVSFVCFLLSFLFNRSAHSASPKSEVLRDGWSPGWRILKTEKIVNLCPFGGLNPFRNDLLGAPSFTKWPMEPFNHCNAGPGCPRGEPLGLKRSHRGCPKTLFGFPGRLWDGSAMPQGIILEHNLTPQIHDLCDSLSSTVFLSFWSQHFRFVGGADLKEIL